MNPLPSVKLNLEGYTVHNLNYLRQGLPGGAGGPGSPAGFAGLDEAEEAARFQAWKACLGVLGIPFLDVVRVLAAVLLLGNVNFVVVEGVEVTVQGDAELKAVASLLGVSGSALFRGLTSRTHNARGQLVRSVCDANMVSTTCDIASLAGPGRGRATDV